MKRYLSWVVDEPMGLLWLLSGILLGMFVTSGIVLLVGCDGGTTVVIR